MSFRILTIGSFTLLHPGHLELFNQCRYLAGEDGEVIVGVNSDDFILHYKGFTPFFDQQTRVEMVEAIRVVDRVIINNNYADQSELIENEHPDILFIGQDWALKDYYQQLGITPKWLADRDILLLYGPRTRGFSSSALIENVKLGRA